MDRSTSLSNIPKSTSSTSLSISVSSSSNWSDSFFSPRGNNGYEPLCFSKEAFSKEHFQVDTFIADCRRRVPLESVLTDLKEYAHSLNSELLELINKDYADFVNLSSNLVGIDKVLHELRKPLQSIQGEVQSTRAGLDQSVSVFEAKLQERREVSEKKARLELFINVSTSISKIEKLLFIDKKNTAGNSDTDLATVLMKNDEHTSNLIERVASEFNQLKFYVSRGKNLAFVKKQEPRIQSIEDTLEGGLKRLFRDSLVSKNQNIIANCLRTYVAIDKIHEAEELFRLEIVKPFASQVILSEKVEEVNGLEDMYRILLQYIKDECSLLLSLTKSIRGFHFLSHCVWAEFAGTIIQRLPKIFTSAFPDLFHKNYLASLVFVDGVESFCNTRQEVDHFRNYGVYQEFMKKWNLTIYFQLRFQDIAGKLESAFLHHPQIVNPVDTNAELITHSSQVLWESLVRCWSPEIYLHSIFHKLFKLSLQLTARFQSWVSQQLANEIEVPSTPAALLDQTAFWVCLYYDTEKLIEKMSSQYPKTVQQLVKNLPEETLAVMQERYKASADKLKSLFDPLTDLVTQHTIKKCVDSLQALRGITAAYRLTNKSVPTHPSFYVETLTAPIHEFTKELDNILKTSHKQDWIKKIINIVIERYIEKINDLLSSVEHAEAVRKKMVKKTKMNSSGTTDINKIYIQLFLDVEAFGIQLEDKFGIDKNRLEAYQRLRECVSTGQKLREELKADSTNL